jgi:DNA-binding transcriptional LysR family regulator
MKVDRIEDLRAFVAVIEHGSLTRAARQLGRSLQSVSRSLAAVECEVGVELVRRTTRRLSPTDAGLAFHRRVGGALGELEAAKSEAASGRSEPAGLLRVSGPPAFALPYIIPAFAAFLAAHPKVSAELELSDRYVDLVDERFDLAIRMGEMPDSTLKSRRLAGMRRVVFAAVSYFAKHGRPRRPEDLARHECIVRTSGREGDTWPFKVGTKVIAVRVTGRFRTSGAFAANEAAAAGLGIAQAPLWQVRGLLDQGRIDLALTRFETPPAPLHAVWPAARVPAAKTQMFVDFLAERLKGERL